MAQVETAKEDFLAVVGAQTCAMACLRQCAFSRRAIDLVLGFCVGTLRKQVLAILQVNDRGVNPIVGRPGP